MAVVITKRRKAYNVIYTIQNENGDIEKRYETFYNREQALKRKEQIAVSYTHLTLPTILRV